MSRSPGSWRSARLHWRGETQPSAAARRMSQGSAAWRQRGSGHSSSLTAAGAQVMLPGQDNPAAEKMNKLGVDKYHLVNFNMLLTTGEPEDWRHSAFLRLKAEKSALLCPSHQNKQVHNTPGPPVSLPLLRPEEIRGCVAPLWKFISRLGQLVYIRRNPEAKLERRK